jgi:YgiT-type zinc finger domain-containing protein
MKCLICHSEDIQVKAVFEEFAQGDDVLRISFSVPVCLSCGERYYDRQAMRRIERIREQLRTRTLELREAGRILIGRG